MSGGRINLWAIYQITMTILQRYKTIIVEGATDLTASLASAAVAEMVYSEADKLKLCITKQLLFCKGNPMKFQNNLAIFEVTYVFSRIIVFW